MNRLVLRMAWKETRANLGKFAFFVLCLAIGVGALVSVKGLTTALLEAMARQSRQLLAADMLISMNFAPTEKQEAALERLRQQGASVARSHELVSVVVPPDGKGSLAVQVKAVEPALYPFYGSLVTEPDGPLPQLLQPDAALVESAFLERLDLKVGDSIKLGFAQFRIAAVITAEPDKLSSGFAFAPRLIISQEGLVRSGLVVPGSRVSYRFQVKLPPGADMAAVRRDLRPDFAGEGARIQDYTQAEGNLQRTYDRVGRFLSLVSLITLLIGGIGVASITRLFIQRKLDSVAIMKCLGATSRTIFRIYITQALFLGLLGSLLGIGLGYLAQAVAPPLLKSVLPVELQFTLAPAAALQGLTIGLLTALVCAALPLRAASGVAPARIFRRDVEEMAPPFWRQALRNWPWSLAVIGALELLSVWLSRSWRMGSIFAAGLVAAVAVLYLAVWLTLRLVRAAPRPRPVYARHGLANLYRPGSQTGAVVLALGIGVTVVLVVYLLQVNLVSQVASGSNATAPNLFFLGVPAREKDAFTDLLSGLPQVTGKPEVLLSLQARLEKAGGVPVRDLVRAGSDGDWVRTWNFTVTSLAELPEGDVILKGAWWDGPAAEPSVSVADDLAERLKLEVGSTLELNVGGLPVIARVASLRRPNWQRSGPSWNLIFSPGSLDAHATTYLAAARVTEGSEPAVQRSVAERFPTVTSINITDVLASVQRILDQVSLAMRFVALFILVAGTIILGSSLAATRFRRIREAVLLKALGATRGLVARAFAVEFLVLGVVSGLVGVLLANALSFAFIYFVFDVTYRVDWAGSLAAILTTAALTTLAGFAFTWDVLGERPLQALREE